MTLSQLRPVRGHANTRTHTHTDWSRECREDAISALSEKKSLQDGNGSKVMFLVQAFSPWMIKKKKKKKSVLTFRRVVAGKGFCEITIHLHSQTTEYFKQ